MVGGAVASVADMWQEPGRWQRYHTVSVILMPFFSRTKRASRSFRARAAEDLRHVRKHAARYACQGEGGRKLTGGQRGLVARVWMKTGKPLYNWITRGKQLHQ